MIDSHHEVMKSRWMSGMADDIPLAITRYWLTDKCNHCYRKDIFYDYAYRYSISTYRIKNIGVYFWSWSIEWKKDEGEGKLKKKIKGGKLWWSSSE